MASASKAQHKKKASSQKSEKPAAEVEKTPVVEKAPVVEKPVEEVVEEVADAQPASDPEASLASEASEIIELAKMMQQILARVVKTTRGTVTNIKKMEREISKLDKKFKKNKTSKANNGNKGLQQLKPVYTSTMKSFFENNHQLKDRNGNVICEKLAYDSENILVSRDQALKLVNAYIREHELQQYPENKRRIKMDTTLKQLFPELVEEKQGKKVVREENCYYHTLMGAIARHFRQE